MIVECAFFKPENIIGKTIEYDIESDAAYKFERGVDPKCHDYVLRRFLEIVKNYADIENVQLFSKQYTDLEEIVIDVKHNLTNSILGTDISLKKYIDILTNLGFQVSGERLIVPSYRNDIKNQNDIAEEVARSLGYNQIVPKEINVSSNYKCKKNNSEYKLKSYLIDHGFYEVINNPFTDNKSSSSIIVDNPLDSNKKYLRISLKQSLINNLLFNERRQKDSVKLFEISDIYSSPNNSKNRYIGIIASGRAGHNYENFSKKIDLKYITSIAKNK